MRSAGVLFVGLLSLSGCGEVDNWTVKENKNEMTDDVRITASQLGKNGKILLAISCLYPKGKTKPESSGLFASAPGTRRDMEGSQSLRYGYEGNFEYRMNGSEIHYDSIFLNGDDQDRNISIYYFGYAKTPEVLDFVISPDFKDLTLKFTTSQGESVDTFTGFNSRESRKVRDECSKSINREHWRKK